MEKPIAVIDPSRLARAGLVSLLSAKGYDRILEADDVAGLDAQGKSCKDVAVIIVRLPNSSLEPKEIMGEIHEKIPNSKVMFLVPHLDIKFLSNCFSSGSGGCLSESASQEKLIGSIEALKSGGKVFPDELAEVIQSFTAIDHSKIIFKDWNGDIILSSREMDILRELGIGQSNKMIAVRLGIAEATVKVYVKRILRKIGVCNRTQAALWAAAHGHVETSRENRQQPQERNRKVALVAHQRTASRPAPKSSSKTRERTYSD